MLFFTPFDTALLFIAALGGTGGGAFTVVDEGAGATAANLADNGMAVDTRPAPAAVAAAGAAATGNDDDDDCT